MNLRLTFLTIYCLGALSCRQTEKSSETMKEAMDVYLFSDLTDSAKVEKSLILTNRALELDDHNLAALSHKQTLLFIKKDIEGLLKTTDYLIKLMPKKPFYLGKKSLVPGTERGQCKSKRILRQISSHVSRIYKNR